MLIGIGCTVPEIVNLPGQSGEEVEVTLDYSLASACNNNNAFSPSQATPSGGVFSVTPSGLNINSSTGEVTPVGSTPQAYVIAYAVSGSTSSFDLTIKPLDNANFSYSASSFPQDGSDPTPVFPSGAITGGAFSATPSGLIINASTGEINLSASTIGSYTVTYNTASSGSSVCPNTSNVSLAVGAAALAQVNNVYSMEFDGSSDGVIIDNSNDTLNLPFLSISLWFKPNNIEWSTIIGNSYYSGAYMAWGVQTAGSVVPGAVRFNTKVGLAYTTDTFNVGEWNHIVVTKDATNGVILYLNNGTPRVISNATAPLAYPTSDLIFDGASIGAAQGSGGALTQHFEGLIDEVAIFNTTLTQAQVTAIYNATEIVSGVNKTADLNALTTPPIKWYRMGD